MSGIVFEDSLTAVRIEEAYRQAIKAQGMGWSQFANVGFRAIVAKDHKVMKALEAMAEVTGKMQEEQLGRTMRDKSTRYDIQRGTTEHQMCREAYRLADEGKPIREFEWIYGAAAWLAGYL
jgi:hypothetical protein